MPTVFHPVRLGIDRIGEPGIHRLLSGGRLGVISAASGISSDYRFPIDILNEQFHVSAILAPEHGPRGILGPGDKVSGGVDPSTGLPVFSLFGDFLTSNDENSKDCAYMPSSQMLREIDLMVFDMQDAGSRYYTYASTLFYTMRACAQNALPLVLLDRPNPLGGDVEGNCSDPAFHSFIGLCSVPIRHGMTLGELARFYNGEFHLGCDLTVVSMDGWNRTMYYPDTGLPFVRPSPNLPTPESLYVYNGTCLLAGTNVSEGRGTTQPFTMIGAEYIHPQELADTLNADKSLDGIRFSPAFFSPYYSKLAGKTLYGVCLHVTDYRALRSVRLGVTLLRTLARLYPDDFRYLAPANPQNRWHIDLLSGNTDLRDGVLSADEICEKWDAQAKAFQEENRQYYLYE